MATSTIRKQQLAEANKRWAENNKERRTYLSKRSTAKSFIRLNATLDDLEELEKLIQAKRSELLGQ